MPCIEPGRSEALLKLKPHLDAEAVVVAHRAGTGKYRGRVGALEVESTEGRRFFVGSGLSDAMRGEPPAIGTTVTYRYRELTLERPAALRDLPAAARRSLIARVAL